MNILSSIKGKITSLIASDPESDSVPLSQREGERHDVGRRGEELAAMFLESIGYRLVASNFELPVGRNRLGAIVNAEIDLVAYDGPTLCFVEVKTRKSDEFTAPESNVDLRKRRQITRAASRYRQMFGLRDAKYRFDVVAIVIGEDDSHEPKIEILKNYWSETRFRKRQRFNWPDDY